MAHGHEIGGITPAGTLPAPITQKGDYSSEIRKDQQKIKGIRTVSSLGDELKVSYGQYSGENKGWNAYLSLYSESIALLDGTFLIYYQALTGKEAVNLVTASDSDYKDYQDTVNMYTSLLLRGDPILYFEFDYSIRAGDDDDERSKYIIDFKTLRIINTITGKTIQTITVNEWSTILPEPGYDIRTAENIAAERQRQLTQERRQQEKKRNMESQPGYYHELGGGGLGGLGLDFIYIGNNSAAMGMNIYFDVAVRSWLFLNAGSITLYSGGSYEDFNIGGKPAIYPPEYPISAGFYGGIGLNRRLHISSWHPALYYLLNAGAYIMDKDISENYGREEHETNGYFFLEHSIGLVMPIASYRGIPSFDLNACYSLVTLPAISSKYMGSFSVGVRLTVHPLLRSKYGSYF
ncbi:MAG: hypothetical protein J1E07_10150 [Treponema sp.]|nr:hypothetical protein [Treponema sp.]